MGRAEGGQEGREGGGKEGGGGGGGEADGVKKGGNTGTSHELNRTANSSTREGGQGRREEQVGVGWGGSGVFFFFFKGGGQIAFTLRYAHIHTHKKNGTQVAFPVKVASANNRSVLVLFFFSRFFFLNGLSPAVSSAAPAVTPCFTSDKKDASGRLRISNFFDKRENFASTADEFDDAATRLLIMQIRAVSWSMLAGLC